MLTKIELFKKLQSKNGTIQYSLGSGNRAYITYQGSNKNKVREVLEAMKTYLDYDKEKDINGGPGVGGYIAGGRMDYGLYSKFAENAQIELRGF